MKLFKICDITIAADGNKDNLIHWFKTDISVKTLIEIE